jgi:hypothetical protein
MQEHNNMKYIQPNTNSLMVKIKWDDLTPECQDRITEEWCESGHHIDEMDYFGEDETIAEIEIFNI